MNVFDQFMKHECKIEHYARYTDDFVIVSSDKDSLAALLPKIRAFLSERLHLELHPNKVSICQPHQGVDFLGVVLRPHSHVLRTKTKNRMLKKLTIRTADCNAGLISANTLRQTLNSYLGVLSHVDGRGLEEKIINDTILELEPERLVEFFEHKR